MSDPYKILGVERGATEDEIKKAYKKLAMKHHPDRGGSEEKFKEINEAYEKIKDGKPDVNSFEEQFRHYNFRDANDIEELLRQAAEARQQRWQSHLRYTVSIGLKEAVKGGKHYIKIPVGNTTETIEVTIPAGIQNGETVKYPRLAKGADVHIKFMIAPDKDWTAQGFDLIRVLKVSVWDLIKGTEKNVDTIYDTTIKLKIPPMTQPGTTMRIKGKGIQSRRNVLQVGDMYVHIEAFIPKDIPEELLSAIHRTNS